MTDAPKADLHEGFRDPLRAGSAAHGTAARRPVAAQPHLAPHGSRDVGAGRGFVRRGPQAGRDDDALVRPLDDLLERALPQPLAGRKIPLELAARGMAEVGLEAQAAGAHDSPFLAAFTGVLTTARRPDEA
ncbi:hypothetical protein [Streptomyces sp. Rer75]|uniref:hypothetical protein n=1 Tax=unclassified Streptomyces TaxID=2593676 RepID=UPI0015CFAFCC|nr:hypothetical protein [Streptomyces sp. Rer75]QLH19652.1 hypothetical protein HYQ63_02500 [Streptomyces sp. Rer75]